MTASVEPQHPPPVAAQEIVLLAGGDVSFGRALGDALLEDPARDVIGALSPWFQCADVRFVNQESQLSEQGGETVHPQNRLVFTGPPSGADALARAHVDIVSLANNHAWDYAKDAFLETLGHLERVGVEYVGAGRDRARARPRTRLFQARRDDLELRRRQQARRARSRWLRTDRPTHRLIPARGRPDHGTPMSQPRPSVALPQGENRSLHHHDQQLVTARRKAVPSRLRGSCGIEGDGALIWLQIARFAWSNPLPDLGSSPTQPRLALRRGLPIG